MPEQAIESLPNAENARALYRYFAMSEEEMDLEPDDFVRVEVKVSLRGRSLESLALHSRGFLTPLSSRNGRPRTVGGLASMFARASLAFSRERLWRFFRTSVLASLLSSTRASTPACETLDSVTSAKPAPSLTCP